MKTGNKFFTRRCVVGVLLALALALISLFAYGHLKATDIDDARIARIRPGMAEEEALAILGLPPGDYRTHEVHYKGFVNIGMGPRGISKEWLLDSRYIMIWFHDGKVESLAEARSLRGPDWIARMRVALGW